MAEQRIDLGVAQDVAAGEAQQRPRAEQVVQQLRRREHRPHPLERQADLGHVPQLLAELGRRQLAAATPRAVERGEELALDVLATGVVPAEAAGGRPDDARRLLGGDADEPAPERHDEVVLQRPLAIADRLVDDVGHAGVALDPSRQVGLDRAATPARGGEPDVGDEIGEHDLLDPGLAERRQHALDVAEEDTVGADDEHALVLEREAERVQQVRGPVQRDHRLAGAGAALDDEHTGLVGADDLVLLGLDRGDDVAERAGAAALERGEQGRVARDLGWGRIVGEPVVVADAEVPLAEQLVLDAEQLAALDREVAATDEAHRLAAGGAVERFGDRRPPVDDDRLGVLIGHREAADVEALAAVGTVVPFGRGGEAVDAAEHERGVAEVEVVQALDQGLVERVALESRLHGATEVGLVEVTEAPGRVLR